MNSEVLKKVLKLRLSLKKKSKQYFLGSYRSTFKGTGMTFSDFRAYEYGDDLRSISWSLTAKMGKPYIKLFEEERGLTFILMIDVSASFEFGSGQNTKKETLQEMASYLAFLVERNQDQIGLLLFSNQVECYIPPSKGKSHVLKIINTLYTFKPKSVQTDFKNPCSYICQVLKKKTTIFLLSDLLSLNFEEPFKRLSHKHDLNVLIFKDPLETELPSFGLIDIIDSETGEPMTIDTSSKRFQKDYKEQSQYLEQEQKNKLKKINLKYFYIYTNRDIFKSLMSFLNLG